VRKARQRCSSAEAEVMVPAVGDILRRFRSLGVPGAPAPAGIPVDRSAAVAAELAPVFRALEASERSGAELVDRAAGQADRLRARAQAEAKRILSRAQAEAARVRAETSAETLADADVQCVALLDEARFQAERIAHLSAEHAPALADEIIRRVLALGGEPEPEPGDEVRR
jgi:cell division septum initiation protein DivIVA